MNGQFFHLLRSTGASSLSRVSLRSSFLCFSLRYSSSNSNSSSAGETAYQEFLNARQKIKELEDEKERQKSQKLYDAWQRAEQAERSPQSTGVAVVRTLVKQERKQKDVEDIDYWKKRMGEFLLEAADRHHYPLALVERGNQFLEQANRKRDDADESILLWKRAVESYAQACSLESPEGCFNQGNLLWNGWSSGGVDHFLPDQKLAMEAFHRAITLGDADSMYFVGVQFLSSDLDGPEQHNRLSEGLQWIEKAAELGHGGALYYLSLLHYNGHEGLGIEACSSEEFVKRLNTAVDAGDPDALFLRGHSYYRGDDGYPANYSHALNDFLAAADMGHADAAVSAGAILHQPHPGVEQDQHKAFQLYQLAGELGSQEGWRNVIACYLAGEGVPQSVDTAKYIAKTMLKEDESGAESA